MGGYFSRSGAAETATVPSDVMAVPTVVPPDGYLPARTTADAAGYDLCSAEDVSLEPGQRATIGTGVKMAIGNPSIMSKFPAINFNVHAQVRGRSGLAKKGIDVFQGTVDADYRGEIKIIVINNSDQTFEMKTGDRIAQLVFLITLVPMLVEVEKVEGTERGEGGFGSTGIRAAATVATIGVGGFLYVVVCFRTGVRESHMVLKPARKVIWRR